MPDSDRCYVRFNTFRRLSRLLITSYRKHGSQVKKIHLRTQWSTETIVTHDNSELVWKRTSTARIADPDHRFIEAYSGSIDLELEATQQVV